MRLQTTKRGKFGPGKEQKPNAAFSYDILRCFLTPFDQLFKSQPIFNILEGQAELKQTQTVGSQSLP